ncbi:MAG: membrane dipeptidase [Spirochaetia bacterium]|jgi:membrane dipeptidase|nr:membrane dipeptidase [Spirochaetia bacterium]
MIDISKKALTLHRDCIVIDPSVQYLTKRTDRTDRSGLTAVGLTIPNPNEDQFQTLSKVVDFYSVIAKDESFLLAETPDSIRRAHAQGRMAHIFLSQDSSFVGNSPKNLLLWYQLGLRIMQPTYNEQNFVGCGCLEPNDSGLSNFGKVLLREAQKIGVTIDLTHVGKKTFFDVCKVSKAPMIISHANPSAVVPNPRNVSDDQIKAVADSGGVIAVCTWAPLIWKGTPGMPTLKDYFDCLEYAIELVGMDHVATSTDSMGTMGAYPKHEFTADDLPYSSVTGAFDEIACPPDNNNRQPADFNGIQDYPLITQEMLRRGYSEEHIRKILGLNLMRVFEETWKSGLGS